MKYLSTQGQATPVPRQNSAGNKCCHKLHKGYASGRSDGRRMTGDE